MKIAITGKGGVGKTTLARLIQSRFSAELLLEIVEENPFLSNFYVDREKFAFQTQIFFLLSRYKQQERIIQPNLFKSTIISDYIFAKDAIFAHLNLKGAELDMYDRLYNIMKRDIPPPDLLILLRASTDILMRRIAMRDRPFERNISYQYLDDLNRDYLDFFGYYSDSPMLIVDTDDIDFVRDREALEGIIRSIENALDTAYGVKRGGY